MVKNLILACLAQIWAPQFLGGWGGGLPLLDVTHCRKLSMYAISRKTYDPNSTKWHKNLILGLMQVHWAKTLSVTRYHGQLSSCKISEKTNDPIWMDGRTDG